MSNRVWVVLETIDYDLQDVVAVYSSEVLAEADAKEMGGRVQECEILDTMRPEVTDPGKVQERLDEASKSRKEWEAYRARQERDAELRANVKPSDRMGLCHCITFSKDSHFINAHGYCGYCGKFIISVFRKHLGEGALQAAINELGIYDRERMRQIAAETP